jgi:drug/metabolite transporter (DMT)-like permease
MPVFSSPRVVASFAAIYLIWGSTFLAIRWAVETIPPFPMMALRCLVGGGILLALSRLREPGSAWPTGRQWLGAAAVGMFLFVGCHGLLAREEQHVPSGVAALFLATIPLFVPLLAWGLTGSGRPSARTTGALVAGFGGVALLVAVQGSGGGGISVTDGGLLLLSAFSWAAGTVATRVLPMPASPLTAAAAPLLAGSVALAIISLATGEASDVSVSAVSGRSLLGLGYLVVMGTVVTFAAYVWLLRHVPPTRVATYAFVNPAVAVLLGWAIAGESLSVGTLLATALIMVAVAVAVSDNAVSPSRRRAMTDSAEPVSPCADRVAGESL